MATPVGLRTVQVFKDVPANTKKEISRHGNTVYTEVTNGTASVVDFIVNEYIEGGVNGVAIPIAPNTTRAIPLQLYNFKATGIVTVVAYGM